MTEATAKKTLNFALEKAMVAGTKPQKWKKGVRLTGEKDLIKFIGLRFEEGMLHG